MNGNAFHDRRGREKDRVNDLGWLEPALVDIGVVISPGKGDIFAIGEIFRRNEAGF